MEKDKLDSLIKNAIDESNDFYDSEALDAKERVWSKVKPQHKVVPLFYRLLAVACILLLIFLSVSTYSNLRYKSTIDKLVETNSQLKQNLKTTKENSLTSVKQINDTIYVEKKNSESEPIVTTNNITDTVYIKQIVYVDKENNSNSTSLNKQTSNSNNNSKINESSSQSNDAISDVNTQLEVNENNIATSETIPNLESKVEIIDKSSLENDLAYNSNSDIEFKEDSFRKEIIIKSDDDIKENKSKKIKIRFGGMRSKMGKETLAFKTKI